MTQEKIRNDVQTLQLHETVISLNNKNKSSSSNGDLCIFTKDLSCIALQINTSQVA
jgi:hypothetical protein